MQKDRFFERVHSKFWNIADRNSCPITNDNQVKCHVSSCSLVRFKPLTYPQHKNRLSQTHDNSNEGNYLIIIIIALTDQRHQVYYVKIKKIVQKCKFTMSLKKDISVIKLKLFGWYAIDIMKFQCILYNMTRH